MEEQSLSRSLDFVDKWVQECRCWRTSWGHSLKLGLVLYLSGNLKTLERICLLRSIIECFWEPNLGGKKSQRRHFIHTNNKVTVVYQSLLLEAINQELGVLLDSSGNKELLTEQ